MKLLFLLIHLTAAVKFSVLDASTCTYIRRSQLQNKVPSKLGTLVFPLNNVFCAEKDCPPDPVESCDCVMDSQCVMNVLSGNPFLDRCPQQYVSRNNTVICCSRQCSDYTASPNCGSCGNICSPPQYCGYGIISGDGGIIVVRGWSCRS
jgi:hypothetical protein